VNLEGCSNDIIVELGAVGLLSFFAKNPINETTKTGEPMGDTRRVVLQKNGRGWGGWKVGEKKLMEGARWRGERGNVPNQRGQKVERGGGGGGGGGKEITEKGNGGAGGEILQDRN